uniref:SCP domain-containing protein n=1 Tax=Oryza nivara TaxID=4536 RepID=A0A0E0HYP3_ORYNI
MPSLARRSPDLSPVCDISDGSQNNGSFEIIVTCDRFDMWFVTAFTTDGPSPSKVMRCDLSDAEKAQFVKLHNDARAAVGVKAQVSWSEAVAAKAREHASTCRTDHIQGP